MLQIIRDILKHDDDKTHMSLLFANQVNIDENSTQKNCIGICTVREV
jgi:hypothetical protein